MRINIYAEELIDLDSSLESVVERVAKTADTGRTYFGARIYLKSPEARIYLKSPESLHTGADDDRSAITFWGPRAKVALLLRLAADAMERSAEP